MIGLAGKAGTGDHRHQESRPCGNRIGVCFVHAPRSNEESGPRFPDRNGGPLQTTYDADPHFVPVPSESGKRRIGILYPSGDHDDSCGNNGVTGRNPAYSMLPPPGCGLGRMRPYHIVDRISANALLLITKPAVVL